METITDNTIGNNRCLMAVHNVKTHAQIRWVDAKTVDEKEKVWRVIHFFLMYLPIARELALTVESEPVIQSGDGMILSELHFLKYGDFAEKNTKDVCKKLCDMRQSLLEHSESLMSKIVLSNTFEVQEPYTEKALQEMAIATKKQITTHETLSLEVMKDTSFEEIVEEVLLICQKNGLRGEYIGEGVIYGYSAGEVLSYGITLTLYEGMQHNVLLLSVAQYGSYEGIYYNLPFRWVFL